MGTYVVFAAAMAFGAALWLLFRSFRRWRQPPTGRTAEARQAEARLWSTLNTNRH